MNDEADLLREAAQTLREKAEAVRRPYGPDEHYDLAVADWLDAEAAIWEALLTVKAEVSPKGYSLTWGESTQPQAVAVARAVLRRES